MSLSWIKNLLHLEYNIRITRLSIRGWNMNIIRWQAIRNVSEKCCRISSFFNVTIIGLTLWNAGLNYISDMRGLLWRRVTSGIDGDGYRVVWIILFQLCISIVWLRSSEIRRVLKSLQLCIKRTKLYWINITGMRRMDFIMTYPRRIRHLWKSGLRRCIGRCSPKFLIRNRRNAWWNMLPTRMNSEENILGRLLPEVIKTTIMRLEIIGGELCGFRLLTWLLKRLRPTDIMTWLMIILINYYPKCPRLTGLLSRQPFGNVILLRLPGRPSGSIKTGGNWWGMISAVGLH